MINSSQNKDNYYNIRYWGEGYFRINSQGNIEISKSPRAKGVELTAIVNSASRAGLQLPLLVRFIDILHDRVAKLYTAFEQAIKEYNYQGKYKLIYPIKVNQESSVVREILKAPYKNVGLEAGSKPELMAVIGLVANKPGTTIICNGYKDSSYIRTALIAQEMGHEVFIVIEKRSEIDIILQEADKLNIVPKLGLRIRLVTKGAGKWEDTGGDKSKFGLNAEQVLEVVNKLKQTNNLGVLQLMHCHFGSQIANIHDIRRCMEEITRYYVELRRLDAPISTIDVGGGLGVDYQGTRSSAGCSMNYSLEEYANHILTPFCQICKQHNLPHPDIISESGRALTAHHAILITNIIGTENVQVNPCDLPAVGEDDPAVLHEICQTYEHLNHRSANETFHYASHCLEEAHAMFLHGLLSLEKKATVEKFFTVICANLQNNLSNKEQEKDLRNIVNERLAAKLFCNLSFFQSLPDAWAIEQIFPIVPISQLNNKPICHSILEDLTCDSDGTIKQYTGSSAITNTLVLPPYDPENPYLLAFFLVGAYQEILGNLHNLFGDINSLDVRLLENGNFEITDLISGDTINNVLNYAHFDTKKLLLSYEKQLITAELHDFQIQFYLNELRSNFSQLTYLADLPTSRFSALQIREKK